MLAYFKKYSDLNDKSNQSKVNKFLKEYKSKYEKQLAGEEVKKSVEIIGKALALKDTSTTRSDADKQFETFTLKQLGLLDYSD